jgi:hypothetical protein
MSEQHNPNVAVGLEPNGNFSWDDSFASEAQSKGQSSQRNCHRYRSHADAADMNYRGQEEVPLPMRQHHVSKVCPWDLRTQATTKESKDDLIVLAFKRRTVATYSKVPDGPGYTRELGFHIKKTVSV